MSVAPRPAVPAKPSSSTPNSAHDRNDSVSTPAPPQQTVYDRSLARKRGEVSLSAFAYIFSEAVQYCHSRSKDVSELEHRLNLLGRHIGVRVLELTVLREGKNAKRETKLMPMLQFVHTHIWRTLFNRPADSMQVSTEEQLQYMIIDHRPLVTEYISVPRDMSQLNCAALVAGIVQSVFSAAQFPCKVTAHSMGTDEFPDRTGYVVKFDDSVLKRV